MNAKTLLALQSVLLFVLVVFVAIGIGLPYVAPPRGADTPDVTSFVPTQMTLPTDTPEPQDNGVRWEYLNVQYSQYDNYGEESTTYPRYEMILTDVEPYSSLFLNMPSEGCEGIEGFTAQGNCFAKNFRGREYVLQMLGEDGWELIELDNQSTEYAYSVDLIFKRLVQP